MNAVHQKRQRFLDRGGDLRRAAALVCGMLLGAGFLWAQAPAAAPSVGVGAGQGISVGPVVPAGANPQGNTQTNTTSPLNNQQNSQNQQRTNQQTNQQRTDQERTDQQRAEQQRTPGAVPELTQYQQLVRATTGVALPIFGQGLFGGAPSTFAPVDDVPITSDYVLGPGDVVSIQMYGQTNSQGEYAVDNRGALSLPGLGQVQVQGMQFSQLQPFLQAQFEKLYRGFKLNVNMAQLRSIRVYVTGEGAVQTGSFTVSSLSTLLTALFASGGSNGIGTLRDIQVRRGTQTIVHFDLYDFLLRGDKSKDIRLQPEDIIYIPLAGPQVAILGSVNVSAIFELKQETTLQQLLQLAGGETSVAAGTQVRIQRIFEHTMRSITDVNLAGAPTALQNGDIVSVTSISNRFRNAVTLRGNVANPGQYPWHPGMRVRDLIPNKESLITRDYWNRQNQQGYGSPGVGLGVRAQTPGTNPNSTSPENATGNIHSNGSLGVVLTQNSGPFGPANDVVLVAPDLDWNYAVIQRLNPVDLTTQLLTFNLGKAVLDGDPSQNLELEPGDVVTIFSKADISVPSAQQTKFIRLEGEFPGAGLYEALPGETLRQLVARAGGLTPEAFLYASEFTRVSAARVQQQRLQEIADQLDAEVAQRTANENARAITGTDIGAIAAGAQTAAITAARLRGARPTGRIILHMRPDSAGLTNIPDIALEDGDHFIVPHPPSTVTVVGEVYSANAFLYRHGTRVRDYLKEAGGPDRDADSGRIYLVRADGTVVSNQYRDIVRVPIYPGDTIVVPHKLSDHTLFRTLVDISAIVSGFGLPLSLIYLVTR